MTCSKCSREIPAKYLACLHCAKVASAIQVQNTHKRYEQGNCERILTGAREVWIQRCMCDENATVYHLAFTCWIEHKSVSFCGHNISMGACRGDGGLRKWEPEHKDNPHFCPLCVDRLLSKGAGICADICSICGGTDGKHYKGCNFRRLEDTELVSKLQGRKIA